MATEDMGDIVRLADNERLDKPDFNAAVADLQNDITARVLGMLVGSLTGVTFPFMGCVSAPSTSWDGGTKFLSIGGAVFYQGGALASPTTAPAGRVIRYDPTKPWQIALTGVDLTAQAAGSQTCVIWARRGTSTADTDTRKRWLPAASAETSFATGTRTRENIDAFVATSATFNGDGQITALTAPPSSDYFPILKITAWSGGGVPTVGYISMWDGNSVGSLVGDIPTRMDSLASAPNLGLILLYLRQGLAYILDSDGGDNWVTAASNPYRGLKQLDEDVPAPALAAGVIADEGSGWTVVAGSVGLTLDSVAGSGTGFTITHALFVAGGQRVAVVVTPRTGGSNSTRNYTVSWDDSNTVTVSFFNSSTGASAAVDAIGFSIVVYCVR